FPDSFLLHFHQVFSGKETEDNWDEREKSLKRVDAFLEHWAAEKRNREAAAGDRDRNREREREGTGGAGGAGGSGGTTTDTSNGPTTSTTTTSSSSSKAAELAGKDGGVKVVVEGISRTVSLGKERGGFGGLVRWGGSDGEGIAGERESASTEERIKTDDGVSSTI
ncbi:hypothetical protein HDU93_003706, partial [Gonapodya sp. JEL0774]